MDKHNLLNKPLSKEYKDSVMAMAQTELLKNKPAKPAWNWMWLSAPVMAMALAVSVLSIHRIMQESSDPQLTEVVALADLNSTDDMETIQHIDILEEL